MSQSSTPSCSRCGTPVPANMRFCSNCGASTDAGSDQFTNYSHSGEGSSLTPPPPPDSSLRAPQPPTMYPQQEQQVYRPSSPGPQGYQPPLQNAQPLPAYAKTQKNSSRSVLGKIGCGVGVAILLILLVLGAAGYFGYKLLTSAASSVPTSTTTGTGSTATTGTGSTPSVPLTTAQINAQITYSSTDLTILNAQEASSFSDDPGGSTPVLVRLNVKEHNPTTGTVYLSYGDNFRLILSDGTSVAPGNEHDSGGIDQTVTRANWIDFPLSSSVDLSKLTLRLGAANQAQMDVALTGNADLSKYQLKTISPNTSFQYAGLKWTLTTVTSSFSADGKQADSGMRYIVVTLKVNNPTSNTYYYSINDYGRLQSGNITNPPTNTTLDSSIAAGTTGAAGTITFLMPQNGGSFTLMMLARTDTTPPASQYTTIFQI